MQGTLTSTPPIGALFARKTIHAKIGNVSVNAFELGPERYQDARSNLRTFLLTKVEASKSMRAKANEEGRKDYIKL